MDETILPQKPNRVIWHHSADTLPTSQFWKINEYHRHEKNFTESSLGYFGGYHYLIEKDGHEFAYRTEEEIGSHDQGENIGSIGICLAGNFNEELPTRAQEIALANLLERIFSKWGFGVERVDPHRFGDNTNCPGTRLDNFWARKIYLEHKISWLRKLIWTLTNKTGNHLF